MGLTTESNSLNTMRARRKISLVSTHPSCLSQIQAPFQAWRLAHQHETNATCIYADSQRFLRELGYVFWDQSRLEPWPLFQRPWEPPDSSALDNERASHRASLRLWDTTMRRSQIFDHRRRGWWGPDDESKVVHPPGKAAPPS